MANGLTDESTVKKDKVASLTAGMKEKAADSTKALVPAKKKRSPINVRHKPQTVMPGTEDKSEETREGSYPFHGARYLGTVPREPAAAEGKLTKDRVPAWQSEFPAAPPAGTRLK